MSNLIMENFAINQSINRNENIEIDENDKLPVIKKNNGDQTK